ncbi:hypothetical protein [Cellulosimicrobium sp. CUA-896]|uniref:hypothetical protein n=1 Tax=Cellulosimicrobium sp. CUA-896 TaxID=1517881 RepID=UPI000967744B|nr:hypothetical protein [Cellulosimicrobium sp. CUA-896]OLT48039.1 hypothetical protein BJF88_03365 [Cellulosimicrobium sp. CUA-896]
MNDVLPVLAALVPSVGVGLLFWVAMRYIVRADRNERAALARLDAEERRPDRSEESPADAPRDDRERKADA